MRRAIALALTGFGWVGFGVMGIAPAAQAACPMTQVDQGYREMSAILEMVRAELTTMGKQTSVIRAVKLVTTSGEPVEKYYQVEIATNDLSECRARHVYANWSETCQLNLNASAQEFPCGN